MGGVPRMRRMDFYTGLVTAVVGAAATWDARKLTMFGDHNVPGAGFFPKILAGLLIVLGLLLAAMALRDRSAEHDGAVEVDPDAPGPARRMLRPAAVLIVFGVIA